MPGSSAELLNVLLSLPHPPRYRLALSGGLDSQVLLYLLSRLRDRLPAPFDALHVHHGLQPEANRWQAFCQRSCDALGVALRTVDLSLIPEPGVSLEAQARDARYAALAGQMQEGEMLLTAHHQDDQAETLLLQLLRGAGLDGLAAMPVCKPWAEGWHARPLLDWSRGQLRAYAQRKAIDWVEDPSNADLRFDRNYLRQRVMPLLQARWPAAAAGMARSAGLLAQSRQWLEASAEQSMQACLGVLGRLLVDRLLELEAPVRAAVLRHWLRGQGASTPPFRRLNEIVQRLLTASDQTMPAVCWAGYCLRRYRGQLWLLPEPLLDAPTNTLTWGDEPALSLPGSIGTLRREPDPGGLPDRLWQEGRVSVCWRHDDLRCRPSGRDGTRSLRKLCQELGIPPWQRAYLPMVCVDGEVAAIGDYHYCGDFLADGREAASRLLWRRPLWLQAAGED